MYVSVLWGDLFGIQMPASSLNGHNKHAIWTALMPSWKVLLCWENPVRNVSSMSSGGSMLRSDSFSLLQASIVTIAEPSLPLLISSPQRLTAWWCRFMCILFRVWLLHLSMCGALSDPPHKGHVAGPVVWLNRLVCLSVCIVSVLYLRTFPAP